MLTDNEIIKAYGCCNLSHDECGGCDNCPLQTAEGNCLVGEQEFDLEREVFNLLNRQKAEIESFKEECSCLGCENEWLKAHYERSKTQAVKEFAERLKEYINGIIERHEMPMFPFSVAFVSGMETKIDNLVKEMVGEG